MSVSARLVCGTPGLLPDRYSRLTEPLSSEESRGGYTKVVLRTLDKRVVYSFFVLLFDNHVGGTSNR